MKVKISGFFRDCPEFDSPQRQTAHNSLWAENRAIEKLKPSTYSKNKIFLLINKIFQRVLDWLYPFEKTNYTGIVAALDHTSKENFQDLSPEELLRYFKRFFAQENSSSCGLELCIDQLCKQYEAIGKLQTATLLTSMIGKQIPEAEKKKLREPLDRLIQEIATLQEGQQSLILANNQHGDELFYLVSQREGKLFFQIIGRGPSMVRLSGIQEIAVAGQAKLVSCLNYGAVDQEFVQKMLNYSPLADTIQAPGFLETLQNKQALPEDFVRHLEPRTTAISSIFWTAIKEMGYNNGMTETDSIRLKIRFEIMTLFSLFKEYYLNLRENFNAWQTTASMFRLCSQSLSEAYEKGIVSQDEVNRLVKELRVIQQAINEASISQQREVNDLKILSMEAYGPLTLTALTCPVGVALPSAQALSSPRYPHFTPPTSRGKEQRVQVQNFSQLNPHMPIITHLETLVNLNALPHQIVQAIYEMEFHPYIPVSQEVALNPKSLWVQCSTEQAEEIMKHLTTLSKRLIDFLLEKNELPIDMYEVFIKMSCMVAFLTHHNLQKGEFSYYSFTLIDRILFYQGKASSYFRYTSYRHGYCIHPANVKTHLEISNFTHKMGDLHFYKARNFNLSSWRDPISEEERKRCCYLQKQMDYLCHLVPKYYDEYHGDDRGGLFSSIFGWINPWPSPLLSAYHLIQIEPNRSRARYRTFGSGTSNRDTPESIQHDPDSVLKEFETLVGRQQVWEERVNNYLQKKAQEKKVEDKTLAALKDEDRLRALMKKHEEYISQSSQMSMPFSKEEQTALLSLLRQKNPQKEIIAFLETHVRLLSNCLVREWVHTLFFHPTLLDTLKEQPDFFECNFCQLMPEFLSQKINQFISEVKKDPSKMETLLFFIHMSQQLKGIYEVLEAECMQKQGVYEVLVQEAVLNNRKYKTDLFFDIKTKELGDLLEQYKKRDPNSLATPDVIIFQLKILLSQNSFSQKELYQIILDMQQLMNHQTNFFDTRELFWIKARYQDLIQQLSHLVVNDDHLHYLLDTLCVRSGLVLDHSPWTGTFPVFSNAQYSINLQTGAITDRVSESAATYLPAAVAIHPLYQKKFPELVKKEVRAMTVKTEGDVTIYVFKDLQKNLCQIEEKNGLYTFYRSFTKAGHPQMLQAAELSKQPEAKESPGFFSLMKHLSKKENPQLPSMLKQRLFIDPKEPLKGYLISSENNIDLEVHFKQTDGVLVIESVIDLRQESPSLPMQLMGFTAFEEGILQNLAQLEDRAHILAWGKKGGNVEKIELPRYGLSFVIQEGSLLCTDPKYAGYQVVLEASIQERKGFPFSLLLKHPDRTYPKKLLVAPADSIDSQETLASPYRGLAYLLSLIQSLISYLRFGTPPIKALVGRQIKSKEVSLPLTAIELRPHTEEFVYIPGQEIKQAQALIQQALKIGDEQLALEVLYSVPISQEEKSLREWLHFLKSFQKNGYAAAVGLKVATKLQEILCGQKKYEQLNKELHVIEENLFIVYLQSARQLTSPLRLSKEAFHRIADSLKKSDPAYYERHLTPFFLKVGDLFELQKEADIIRPFNSPSLLELKKSQERSKIEQLEEEINPEHPLQRESLSQKLHALPQRSALIFNLSSVADNFDLQTQQLTRPGHLLKKVIIPKQKQLEKEKMEAKKALDNLLRFSSDPLLQLGIYAEEKRPPTSSDLLLALLQKNFASLKEKLPSDIDLEHLKQAVICFYDLEVKYHHLSYCRQELVKMMSEKDKNTSKSLALLNMLTYEREYDPTQHPELLAFEAFNFVTFRTSIDPTQILLLKQLIETPSSIIQAGTGTGKSSVLSVLRAFMRANGTNLVTQKVLPHLLDETVAILQSRLGHLKRKLYVFLFKQSMPLSDREGNSLFEQIYQNLLETIRHKGCVLTDYKSFPLLEQKWISLSKQLMANHENGATLDPILLTHWFYLRKILILLDSRDDQLMDEFDQPLSAIQRIQTQLREGPLFERWKIEESLAVYDILQKDGKLLLNNNLQGEISQDVREASIKQAAWVIAAKKARVDVSQDLIYSYLIGENEEILTHLNLWSSQEKDALAFLKDQFTTYLPLTLSRCSTSHYARGQDGKKVVTSSKGEKRDAKFGNPIEEINYTIQDYLQNKISLTALREWIVDSKKDWATSPKAAEKRFSEILPGVSLAELVYLPPDDFEDRLVILLQDVNHRQEAVSFFLKRHLESLRTSGIVISTNPQDSVAMSLAVSGVSATVGSLGSLHTQFKTNLDTANTLREKMIDRLKKRSLKDPIRYDPLKPLECLSQITDPRLCAIIDGNGAFRSINPEEVAQALLQANPCLKRVEFYDKEGRLAAVGAQEASLTEKGFYFPQAQTRGSDQVLNPNGIALMTAGNKGSIEDFIQEQGRMRHPDQKVLVAISSFAPPHLKTLHDLIQHKEDNRNKANQDDRYQAELQRLRHMMRHAARQELLHVIGTNKPFEKIKAELPCFFSQFKPLESLFIQSTSAEEEAPGDYFSQHKHLIHQNADPIEELKVLQQSLIYKCEQLGISTQALQDYDLRELGPFMPKCVLPQSMAQEQQVEVEEELEVNNEVETEQQQEVQIVPNKVEAYLPRSYNGGQIWYATVLHKAFSSIIAFTDSYLPQTRVDQLHKRTPFDDRTPRVGVVSVILDTSGNLEHVVIGDLLDDVYEYIFSMNPLIEDIFHYDIRIGKVTSSKYKRDYLINSEPFIAAIAQIKFIDGMTDGYSEKELQCLAAWLQQVGVQDMYLLFSTKILKYRPEQRFVHSQLWNFFKEKMAAFI